MRKATLKELYELQAAKQLCGVFLIENTVYHAAPGLSKSALDDIEESPSYFKWRLNSPEKWTEALIFGSAYHTRILEPDHFDSQYYVTESQPRVPKRDEKGRLPISTANLSKIDCMATRLAQHEKASKLIRAGKKEVSFFWTDPTTGILCKARPDLWLPEIGIVADLKSMNKRPTVLNCSRAIEEGRHHVQAALIMDGIRLAIEQSGEGRPEWKDPDSCVFIYQHKDEDFDVAARPMDPTTIVAGEQDYRRNLETYVRCVTTDKWPGICEELEEVGLPIWNLNKRGQD